MSDADQKRVTKATHPTVEAQALPSVASDALPAKPAPAAPAPAGDVLAGIADLPPVQQHAIDSAAAPAVVEPEAGAAPTSSAAPAPAPEPAIAGPGATGPRDMRGAAFDAKIHQTNADGTPRVSKGGRLFYRPGVRFDRRRIGTNGGISESKAPVQSIVGEAPAAGAAPSADNPAVPAGNFDPVKIEQCAKTMTALFFAGGCMIFGDDGQPIVDKSANVDEPQEIYQAFHSYFSVKGAKDIPPGVILAIAFISYGRRRVTLPKVKTRFGRFKETVVLWWTRLRMRRAANSSTIVEQDTEGKKAA